MGDQWVWGVVAAAITGPLIILVVSRGAERSTSLSFASAPRPEGLRLAGALLWEGAVYGAALGLTQHAQPRAQRERPRAG
jgi:hypothetical protein